MLWGSAACSWSQAWAYPWLSPKKTTKRVRSGSILPDQKAAQVFHAAEKILPFQNGTGIRYITQYSQAHFPAVDNQGLFYTFQGLTSDGEYYVSVILPVHLTSLGTLPTPANAEESASSFKTARDLLNQGEPAIQPSLESLDALVQSIIAGIQQ